MFNHYRIALVIAVVFALVAVGCADGDGQSSAAANNGTEQSAADSSTTEPAPSETTGASAASTIATTKPDGPYVGSWHDKLTVEEASDLGDGRLAGPFKLTLNADGTYSMEQSLDPPLDGRYAAASGNRLVFREDTGCDMNFAGVGVYTWKITGGELVLKNVVPETGGCTGRTDTLEFPVWQRR